MKYNIGDLLVRNEFNEVYNWIIISINYSRNRDPIITLKEFSKDTTYSIYPDMLDASIQEDKLKHYPVR
jgi:hypothetical protein